ncbi:MAG: 4Fe-4S dicluster domain-containing protein [Nitrososphaerota archaeon]
MSEHVLKQTKTPKIDPKFRYEVAKMKDGEKITRCFQCGTCTSDCPIARFSDIYRPRQIIRMVQLGLRERMLSSDALWLCASCFTCTDRCPQDADVASIIRVLRNLAAEEGRIPQVFKDLGSNILNTGYAYKIPEMRIKRREALGLPPLPKGSPESMSKMFSEKGFLKIVEGKSE